MDPTNAGYSDTYEMPCSLAGLMVTSLTSSPVPRYDPGVGDVGWLVVTGSYMWGFSCFSQL